MEITLEAPAKINLVLKITGKRKDGYHQIKSVFQKVGLFDTLSFHKTSSGRIEVECLSPDVPVDSSNIIVKAAKLLRESSGVREGVTVKLVKRIPVASGLGGGSSNAAATLVALRRIWNISFPMEKFSELALKAGADTPFFLGGSLALAEGVGEKLTPLTAQKSMPILLVNPGFKITAAEAYKESRFEFAPFEFSPEMVEDIRSGAPQRICRRLVNDLEPWAMEKYPELLSLKRKLENADPAPLGTMMSGSGPTIFSIYPDVESLKRAEKNLAGVAPFVKAVNTLTV